MKIEASQAKGRKFGMFTSRPPSLLSRLVKAARFVNLAFCHESWTIHESSTCQRFQESQIFRFEQLFCFENNFVHRCPNWVIQVDMERQLRVIQISWRHFPEKISKIPLNLLHVLEWWLLEMEWCLSEFLSIIKAFPAFSKGENLKKH